MRRPANANPRLTPDWLRRRYLRERAPVETIADDAGCDVSTVYRALTRFGIPHRGSHSSSRPTWGDILTSEFLQARVEAGWNMSEIARDAAAAAGGGGRCSSSTVMWWLAKRGLLSVDDPRADRAVAWYRDEDWTLQEIADQLHVTKRRVTIWLMARGVELYGPGAPLHEE
ncbi:hypothetical protein ETD86_37300 [Nonomuraea turkmeniaca]|uniref:Uncharacterized protein n=1 Tax=Nonomuraea turkmeniaca TaxID=103838 RepID=A0A5S4FP81_9ACTN|nr:hypothetical protein [Nonomuraea turkmeniaca]TMR10975.1 hypothetical protein ETD86_37300 [Nonomuraea turkmeniaca]